MVNCIKIPDYFHRDYENDLPKQENKKDFYALSIRLARVALPFISLYQPAGKALSVVTGLTRTLTSISSFKKNEGMAKPLLNTALSIASIAGTIFLHPVGLLITSGHDMGLNVYKIYGAIQNREAMEAAKQTLHLANNAFYLFTMLHVSIELKVASLAIQVIVGSVSSFDEFKKGNWLEGCANLAMAAIRVHQLVPQAQQMKKKWEIEAAIKRVFVGELHAKWQFPSDHLPVGVEIDGVKVVSWNVLNNAYMEWVTDKDSQGLKGSMISDLDKQIQADGLTVRDLYVVQMVNSMMNSSKDVIALQECGDPFLTKLQESMPENWNIVRSSREAVEDQDVILYNTRLFSFRSDLSEVSHDAYPSAPGRPIQNALLERVNQDGKSMRIINAHIPGDPRLSSREEFAKYVQKSESADETLVALGDNNFERHEMLDAYNKAGMSGFKLYSPWQTNIDPYTKKSKAIDHVLVKGEVASRELTAEEVLDKEFELKETISLLRTPKKCSTWVDQLHANKVRVIEQFSWLDEDYSFSSSKRSA